MSSTPTGIRAALRSIALGLALAACAGCGAEVPHGGAGVLRPTAPRVVRRLGPTDVLPGDLDLVVRIDVARMRAGLGGDAADRLADRAAGESGEALLRDALKKAEVVWLGLRLADVDAGDRVVVAEGPFGALRPDAPDFHLADDKIDGVTLFDRIDPPPRAGTARVVSLGPRAIAFVSPVELDSVARVLRDGADDKRGDPVAEGVISLDLRAHRLPPSLERRFPSIGAIIAGIERVRATAVLVDDGLRVEAQIAGKSRDGAERALRFLLALRDNVEDARYSGAIRAAKLELVGTDVRLDWTIPAKLVLSLASGAPAPAP